MSDNKAKTIKIWPAPHLEIRIHATQEMINDFNNCHESARRALKEDDCSLYADCKKCSWRDIRIDGNGICASLENKIAKKVKE